MMNRGQADEQDNRSITCNRNVSLLISEGSTGSGEEPLERVEVPQSPGALSFPKTNNLKSMLSSHSNQTGVQR